MIKLEAIQNLGNNDGMTLKRGEMVRYRTGWQVSRSGGWEFTDALECYNKVCELEGNCGIWKSDGIYYVDISFRVKTKKEALNIARAENQLSIYGWAHGDLVFC